MHIREHLETQSYLELLDHAVALEKERTAVMQELAKLETSLTEAKTDRDRYRNTVTEILLEVHGRGNCGFRKRIIDNVERIAENALSQTERPNELPF